MIHSLLFPKLNCAHVNQEFMGYGTFSVSNVDLVVQVNILLTKSLAYLLFKMEAEMSGKTNPSLSKF